MNSEEVFINLTVLSKIMPGDKLLLENDKLLNIDVSYVPCVTRWLKGICRMDILQFISHVLSNAFLYHQQWITEKNDPQLFRLTADLKNALTGLYNLKQTYVTDKLVQAELDVMMENIRAKLYYNK